MKNKKFENVLKKAIQENTKKEIQHMDILGEYKEGDSVVIQFMLPVDHIQTVNRLHQPIYKPGVDKYGRRRMIPLIVKSNEAKKATLNYLRELEKVIPLNDDVKKINFNVLDVTYGLYLVSSFNRRDWDNPIKIFQDTLAKHLGFNDHNIVNGHTYKRLLKYPKDYQGPKLEFIFVCIRTNAKIKTELEIPVESLPKPGIIKFEVDKTKDK